MNQKQYEKGFKQLKALLAEGFEKIITEELARTTPKLKMEEFLAYPDSDVIDFTFSVKVSVRTLKRAAGVN